MCTVTFLPIDQEDFVLTSNRDEAPFRETDPPAVYAYLNSKLLFPKDKHAGGTWIGISDQNRVLSVLNGGFRFHKRKGQYRLSRGILAKNLLASSYLERDIEMLDCSDIEPFTMIIVDWNDGLKCLEFVWDGKTKHLTDKGLKPSIWSSSTLYSDDMKHQRQQWFDTYKREVELDADKLMTFHKTTEVTNKEYGVIMDRGFVKTTSITQVRKKGELVNMEYQDLISGEQYLQSLPNQVVNNE